MKWLSSSLLALALIGCPAPAPTVIDDDGDGFASADDCDDQNAAVNPNAIERCNDVDDDCDGDTDENLLSAYYTDGDGDSFGNPQTEVQACERPVGTVDNALDCDDADNSISPNAVEECDDIDHNCDGDARLGAIGGPDWFPDADGDGFPDDSGGMRSCDQPTGFLAAPATDDGFDCDDTNADVRPGASETCNSVDDDCDGEIDDNPIDGVNAPIDQDGDGFGSTTVSVFVCNIGSSVDYMGTTVPTVALDNNGDCNDLIPTINPGVTETCNGIDDDCDPATDENMVASDARVWWRDTDGDGVGVSSDSQTACFAPVGYVVETPIEDCAPNDFDIGPGAADVCDGVDNDCSGLADDNPTNAPVWFADTDGDGLGDANSDGFDSCTAIAGRIDNGLDCDDTSAVIGEAFLFFEDLDGDGYGSGLQQSACVLGPDTSLVGGDCDDTDPTINQDTIWFLDMDGDGFGDDLMTQQVCEQPASYVSVPGDCDDTEFSVRPGAIDGPTINLIDEDCDGMVDEDSVIEHCGLISSTEVWDSSAVHRVTCNVTVDGIGQPSLIIQGAEVLIEQGAQITVGGTTGASLDVTNSTFSALNPGETWDGLELRGAPSEHSLENVVIRNANGSGIDIDEATVELTNVDVQFVSGDGLIIDGEAVVSIEGGSFSNNTGHGIRTIDALAFIEQLENVQLDENDERPLSMSFQSIGNLANNTFVGNENDEILILGGTLTEDAVWSDLGVGYRVDGDLFVEGPASPNLTIEDGVNVFFGSSDRLVIGAFDEASLTVEGLPGAGVVFDGEGAVPGSWDGILLASLAEDSSVANLTVRNAGDDLDGAFVVNGDPGLPPEDQINIDLVGLTVEDSVSNGLIVRAGNMSVTDGTFSDNGDAGVQIDVGVVEATSTFEGNIAADNQSSGARVHPELVRLLDGANVYSGNMLPLEITGGDVVDTATWNPLSEDYFVSGVVEVANVDSPILSLAAGTTLYFGEDGAFEVGVSDQGSIQVDGTMSEPVVMTALTEITDPGTTVRGSWQGITIGREQRESYLTYAEVLYAGRTNGLGALTLQGSMLNPLPLQNLTIRDSGAHGIYGALDGAGGAFVVMHDSNVSDSDDAGMLFDAGGVEPSFGAPVTNFTNNVIAGNGGPGLVASTETAGELADSTFANNNQASVDNRQYIGVYGGTMRVSMTWRDMGVPYRVLGEDVRVVNAAIWTLEPGVEVQVEAGMALEIKVGFDDQTGGIRAISDLNASGEAENRIVFTSSRQVPLRGDWGGLVLGEECFTDTPMGDPVGCVLDGVDIDYAGADSPDADRGALEIFVSEPFEQPSAAFVTRTRVRYSLSNGFMYWYPMGIVSPPEPIQDPAAQTSSCEDVNRDFVCDTEAACDADPTCSRPITNTCWTGTHHGETNLSCGHINQNVFARDDESPYNLFICADPGPDVCP